MGKTFFGLSTIKKLILKEIAIEDIDQVIFDFPSDTRESFLKEVKARYKCLNCYSESAVIAWASMLKCKNVVFSYNPEYHTLPASHPYIDEIGCFWEDKLRKNRKVYLN